MSAWCEQHNFRGSMMKSQYGSQCERKSSCGEEPTIHGVQNGPMLQYSSQPDMIPKASSLTTTNTCNRVTPYGSHPHPTWDSHSRPESKTVITSVANPHTSYPNLPIKPHTSQFAYQICSCWHAPRVTKTLLCHQIYSSCDSWLMVKSTSPQQNLWHQTCFLLYCDDRADPQMANSDRQGNEETRPTRTANKKCNKRHTPSPPNHILHQPINYTKVHTGKQLQIFWTIKHHWLFLDNIASLIIKWK